MEYKRGEDMGEINELAVKIQLAKEEITGILQELESDDVFVDSINIQHMGIAGKKGTRVANVDINVKIV